LDSSERMEWQPTPLAKRKAQSFESNAVATFLKDIGLGKYAKPLILSGFDDMETLLDIENEHMREIGFPPGHIVKLKKKLREYADENPSAALSPKATEHVAAVSVPKNAPRSQQPQPTSNMMTTVQMSWIHVKNLGTDKVGEAFYKKFFVLVPESKELFPISVRARYRDWSAAEEEDENDLNNSPAMRKLWAKVIDAVGSAVAGLHDPNKLVPMLQQLCMRHVGYGLKTQYFELAAKILIEVLSEGLGDKFTKDVEQAWVTIYNFMTATMISGFQTAETEARAIQAKVVMTPTPRTASLPSLQSSRDDFSVDRAPPVVDEGSPAFFDQHSSWVDSYQYHVDAPEPPLKESSPQPTSFIGFFEAATAKFDKLPRLLANLQTNSLEV